MCEADVDRDAIQRLRGADRDAIQRLRGVDRDAIQRKTGTLSSGFNHFTGVPLSPGLISIEPLHPVAIQRVAARARSSGVLTNSI